MPTPLMQYATISKEEHPNLAVPNLVDYEATRATFQWETERSGLLKDSPAGDLNIARLAVERHALGAAREKVALRWLGRHGEQRDLT